MTIPTYRNLSLRFFHLVVIAIKSVLTALSISDITQYGLLCQLMDGPQLSDIQ